MYGSGFLSLEFVNSFRLDQVLSSPFGAGKSGATGRRIFLCGDGAVIYSNIQHTD